MAWQRVIDVNLSGVFFASRSAARVMIPRRRGCIVNVASVGGMNAGITGRQYPNAAYRSSKGGVISLTRALAVEWAPHNIRVNAVAPGYVNTPMAKNLTEDPKRLTSITSSTPLGRIAEPEDVAWAIAFLGSAAASMITGHTLPVDGGLLA
jgi:NAD(P)-dependent dehydrogenase (short-subunit alcohol dehydrogenase family)